MNKLPKISVILPVYNAGLVLKNAIESILNQTFTDFECIIINDGSTDDSAKCIAGFNDPRIRVVTQINKGLRGALNVGIAHSTGQYIARMDQDDISLPERFAKQVAFLDTHSDHVLVGTTYAYIDEQGKITGSFPALLNDEDLKREMYTKAPFGHGTVMLRASAIKRGNFTYSQEAVHMEDYDLWIRFSIAGKYANLPEILYLWRQSSTNTTSTHAHVQRQNTRELQKRVLAKLNLKGLTKWPGWASLRKYRNTSLIIQGEPVIVRRRDAHCSLYLVLARMFFDQQKFLKAAIFFFYGVLISPIYVLKAARQYNRNDQLPAR